MSRMLTVPVYNQEGQPTGTLDLLPSVFGVRVRPAVLHQAIVAQQANARHAIAHTKTRGEVRGGGRKPWRQKGTGRARHGSIRSPIWVGGGTTFGPRSTRVFALKINTKMRRAALRMALSDKVASKRFVVLEDFTPLEQKTKAAKRVLDAVTTHAMGSGRRPTALLVLPKERRDAVHSVRNLPRTMPIAAAHLNTHDVVRSEMIVATRAAIAYLESTAAQREQHVRQHAARRRA